MSKVNDGGPAFPSNRDMRYGGMTLRQYAAIKLRVPNSGADWLDEMIRTSLRDDLAEKAMQGLMSNDGLDWMESVATASYGMADAMLKARTAKRETDENPILLLKIIDYEFGLEDVRAINCLEKEGIYYVRDLIRRNETELRSIVGLGRKSIGHIKDALAKHGLKIGTSIKNWPYDSEGTPV